MKSMIVLLYLIFFAFSIPWFIQGEIDLIIFGFPLWAFCALCGSVLISVLTAAVLSRPWPGEQEEQ